jgi:hypothetical protein
MTTTTLPALDGLAQELRLMAGDTMFDDRKRQLTRWATEVESLEAALAVPAQQGKWMPQEPTPEITKAATMAWMTRRPFPEVYAAMLEAAGMVMCESCNGHGIIPDGYSGRDDDGNAPMSAMCEDCGGKGMYVPDAPPGTAAPESEPSEATRVCQETYAALGSILFDMAERGHPQAEKLMDNLAAASLAHRDVLPFHPAPSASGDALNARRYEWLRNRTGAWPSQPGAPVEFRMPLPSPIGNALKGSVAGHLDAAIDAQITKENTK